MAEARRRAVFRRVAAPAPKRRPPARRLVIMLKEPVMGRVKTRLGREIGAATAVRFARSSARSVIARLYRDRRWTTLLAVAPRRALGAKIWPAGIARLAQGTGDLGACMLRFMPARPGPVILIGADIPAVTAPIIWQAFQGLRDQDVVFGPAEDGGFWLVGLNPLTARRGLFDGVRWSTPFALADSLANLGPRKVGFAARLGDVDDAESYRRLGHQAARLVLPAASPARSR